MNEVKKYGLWLAGLAVIVLVLYFIFGGLSTQPSQPQAQSSTDPNAFVPPPIAPPRTASNTTVAEAQHAFQSLVSYTDEGFSPADLTITQGQTVRFTNNSSGPLHVSSVKVGQGIVYPGKSSACKAGALDSCTSLKPGEYWQFTFEKSGTWGVEDKLHTINAAVVQVN